MQNKLLLPLWFYSELHSLVYLGTNPASFNSLILLVSEGVCVWAGSLVLLEVRGQLVGLCLILATIRLRHLVLWRLWHLSEVVVGAAHYPWIGKDRGDRWIETWKVKLILNQYWARRCLVEGHLRVGDPLQVVWVGACRQARGKAAWAHRPTHWVSTARIEGILQTGQRAVLWTENRENRMWVDSLKRINNDIFIYNSVFPTHRPSLGGSSRYKNSRPSIFDDFSIEKCFFFSFHPSEKHHSSFNVGHIWKKLPRNCRSAPTRTYFQIKAEDFCVCHSHSLKQIQAFIIFGNTCLFEFETKTLVRKTLHR